MALSGAENWAKDAIGKAEAHGLASASFASYPANGQMTRADAAVLLDVYFKHEAPGGADNKATLPFTDLSKCSAEQKQAIANLYGLGIMLGTSDDKFSPSDSFTRAQHYTELYRIEGLIRTIANGTAVKTFTDKIPDWAKDAVTWAASNGILTGYPDGSFAPNNVITFQEGIVIVERIYEFIHGSGETGQILLKTKEKTYVAIGKVTPVNMVPFRFWIAETMYEGTWYKNKDFFYIVDSSKVEDGKTSADKELFYYLFVQPSDKEYGVILDIFKSPWTLVESY